MNELNEARAIADLFVVYLPSLFNPAAFRKVLIVEKKREESK